MRQVLGAGALGRPRGIGWRGRWEGGSGWGIHVNPWLIHVNVWQKPLQYCKVISLQPIKKKKKQKQTNKLTNVLLISMPAPEPLGKVVFSITPLFNECRIGNKLFREVGMVLIKII